VSAEGGLGELALAAQLAAQLAACRWCQASQRRPAGCAPKGRLRHTAEKYDIALENEQRLFAAL